MKHFYTPDEYLAHYDPNVVQRPVSYCPACHSTDLTFHSSRRWRASCVCNNCGQGLHVSPPNYLLEEPQTKSPEEYVFSCIQNGYRWAYIMMDRGPNVGRGLGALAQVGMMSSNATYARQSMVVWGQQQLKQYRRDQAIAQAEHQIETEYRYALQLADDYFHGAERQAEADAAHEADMRKFARLMVDEMANRVEQQRGQEE